MTTPLAIIILAAGMGTRMKSALPKVMHTLAHRPMLAHVLHTALKLSPTKIITVVGPGMESAHVLVKKTIPDHIESAIVEQTERLGTGHAVKTALPALEGFTGDVMVLYGDTPLITSETLVAMRKKLHENYINGVVVLGFTPHNPAQYGRLKTTDKGELSAIIEYKDANAEERAIPLCNSGVKVTNADLLRQLIAQLTNNNASKEYYLTDIVGLAKAVGRVSSYTVAAEETEVMGVNDRIQLSQAESALQHRLRTQAMLHGVTLIAPETVHLASDTSFGRDIILHPHVVIGPGVILEDNVEIRSFSHIEEAHVKSYATIGPFARLRPGTDIGAYAHIGNFVEIKKSTIAEGAKINHLSYIGDASIGTKTNVGAGTITCNYDGFHKYETIIGKECFIGSHSTFIAPVTVGDGAITAAGSVITHDVDDDSLAISRAEQQVIPGKALRIRQKKSEGK